MTIRKGHDWGEPTVVPHDLMRCATDAAAAAMTSPFSVTGGDLFRCLGSPGVPAAGSSARAVRVDGLRVTIDDVDMWAISSVEVGRWWGVAPYHCVSNAGFIGPRNVAPRSHPNDGHFEVVTLTAPLRQRIQIERRSRVGAHLPHPQMSVVAASQWSHTKRSPQQVLRVDGRRIRQWHRVSVTLVDDHYTVIV